MLMLMLMLRLRFSGAFLEEWEMVSHGVRRA